MKIIVNIKIFEIFKRKPKKWPTQDLSNVERNKVMKNQPIQGILWRLVHNNQPGGIVLIPSPCRIGLIAVETVETVLTKLVSIFQCTVSKQGFRITSGPLIFYYVWPHAYFLLLQFTFSHFTTLFSRLLHKHLQLAS